LVQNHVNDGEAENNMEKLAKRDGMAIWNADTTNIKATKSTRVLLISQKFRWGQ